jgi:hypothetical protein
MTGLLIAFRLLLGGVFLISAFGKLIAPSLFVNNVVKYRILPIPLAKAYGWMLPFLELGASLILLSGWNAKWGALIVVAMVISFIIAVVIVIARRQNLSCGCFGLLYRERVGIPTLVRDAVIVAMGLYIFAVDNGNLSISNLISDGVSTTSILIITFTVIVAILSIILAIISVRPNILSRVLGRNNKSNEKKTLEISKLT